MAFSVADLERGSLIIHTHNGKSRHLVVIAAPLKAGSNHAWQHMPGDIYVRLCEQRGNAYYMNNESLSDTEIRRAEAVGDTFTIFPGNVADLPFK
jgi:hypothetical protein